MEAYENEWRKLLKAPEAYRFERGAELVKRCSYPECDAELYVQNNGPGTVQRVLKVFPKELTTPAPAVAVPFYFPEAMLGFELESREKLPRFAGITMLCDLARRGFVAATADAYHLTFRKSGRDRMEWARWQEAGEALHEAYPEWCGMGKLCFDTGLLIDLLAEDERVDTSRIGIAGHSLGGKMAFYAGCLDARIKVIMASDFGIGWDQTNWHDVWYWGSRVEELKARGMDHSQLLSMAGGKPFLLLAGKFDDFDSWRVMERASGYEEHPERRVILNHASGHRPPAWALAAGYGFLEHFLGAGRTAAAPGGGERS